MLLEPVFKGLVTTCSMPIIESTRLPRLATRGEGSLAKVHIAFTQGLYIVLSRGFGLQLLVTPLLMPSLAIAESECWDESSDNGDPCIIPEEARGLHEEILPSRITDELSAPAFKNGPTILPGVVYPLPGALI